MIGTVCVIAAAALAALHLGERTAAYWQLPVAVILLAVAALVGVDGIELEVR